MKHTIIMGVACLTLALSACGNKQAAKQTAPADTVQVVSDRVPLADPFILCHEGTYYAYGTHSDDGIEVFTSHNLTDWRLQGLALHKDNSWGDRWFWAPEVYHVNGRFYMYYSADEHICVATSDSPLGPFVQKDLKPMITGEKCIDNSLFIDTDGRPYLFFDRFNDGLNIWVAELGSDFMTVKEETLRPCIHVSQPWEEVWPRVNEGSFVIRHKGTYYMTYSANSYESPFYGIGCATATSVTGEWTKYPHNPLLQNNNGLTGVGHSSMFTDKNGRLRIVYHAHKDDKNIHPRAMYIGEVSFRPHGETDRLEISPDYIVPRWVK